MADALAVVTQLSALLERENAALRGMDLAAAAAMLAAKQDAAAALAAARPVADRDALRRAVAALRVLAEENRVLLERAIAVQARVLAIIAQASRAAEPAPRYGRSGAYAARRATGYALSLRS